MWKRRTNLAFYFEAPLICKLTYLENDMDIERGMDKLVWYKLREGGRSTRAVAKCCHSTLAVDHPAYKVCSIYNKLNLKTPNSGGIITPGDFLILLLYKDYKWTFIIQFQKTIFQSIKPYPTSQEPIWVCSPWDQSLEPYNSISS